MINKKIILLGLFVFLIISCEDDNQITGEVIEPDLPEYTQTDLDGYGCSEEYLCDHIGNIYFNFLSNDSYSQQFYKFNSYHLTGGAHDELTDLLNFNSYHSVYYVPFSSIVDSLNDTLLVYNEQDGYYEFSENSNIAFLNQDSLSSHQIVDTLLLTSTVFSILEGVVWNPSSNRYSFSTVQAFKDSTIYPYSHDYDSISYSTLLDTVLNDITGDLVLLDTTETVTRNFINYDTLVTIQSSDTLIEPVKIKRSKTYYIKDIFVRNNGMMFRESTDCNDNYQQDEAEKTIEDYENECLGFNATWVENTSSACNSYCDCTLPMDSESQIDTNCNSIFGSNLNMDALCWNEFVGDLRLTGHCYEDEFNNNTFCDTGNNLYDNSPEYYYDTDESGSHTLSGQEMEPWEDRNCNKIADISINFIEQIDTSLTNEIDCNNAYGSWDGNSNFCYYDKGNEQWDNKESCYTGDGCDYKDLYKRADQPNILMVDYIDNDNPNSILTVLPSDTFNDCGSDNVCNENEPDYNYGICNNGNGQSFSGSETDCCKYNGCWNYFSEECDFLNLLNSCYFIENGDTTNYDELEEIWTVNLDPNGDDYNCLVWNDDNSNGELDHPETCTSDNGGTEGNDSWDNGESLIDDFNDNGSFTFGTTLVNKTLDYSICNNDCGGESFDIIEDSLRQILISKFVEKIESEVTVNSFNVIDQVNLESSNNDNIPNYLNDLNIVKTDFINFYQNNDYDYILFMESEAQDASGMHYIIKLIHPYYFFAPGFWILNDNNDIENQSDLNDFWSSVYLENDTLLYSMDGQVIEGQTYYSNYSVESDTANYQVHKEYFVTKETARRTYDSSIADCFKITRIITTTMLGSGLDFKLKTETYLKSGYPIVKEDVFTWWASPPWGESSWLPISSIEYKESTRSDLPSIRIFSSRDKIDLKMLDKNSDFDFKPFRLSNTIGLQRIEYPR